MLSTREQEQNIHDDFPVLSDPVFYYIPDEKEQPFSTDWPIYYKKRIIITAACALGLYNTEYDTNLIEAMFEQFTVFGLSDSDDLVVLPSFADFMAVRLSLKGYLREGVVEVLIKKGIDVHQYFVLDEPAFRYLNNESPVSLDNWHYDQEEADDMLLEERISILCNGDVHVFGKGVANFVKEMRRIVPLDKICDLDLDQIGYGKQSRLFEQQLAIAFKEMTNLQTLSLTSYHGHVIGMSVLVSSLASSLTDLAIGCLIDDEIDFSVLSNLRRLLIKGFSQKTIYKLSPSLTELELQEEDETEENLDDYVAIDLGFLASSDQLETVIISSCKPPVNVEVLQRLKNLRKAEFNCCLIASPLNFSNCLRLKELTIYYIKGKKPVVIAPFGCQVKLKVWDIEVAEAMERINKSCLSIASKTDASLSKISTQNPPALTEQKISLAVEDQLTKTHLTSALDVIPSLKRKTHLGEEKFGAAMPLLSGMVSHAEPEATLSLKRKIDSGEDKSQEMPMVSLSRLTSVDDGLELSKATKIHKTAVDSKAYDSQKTMKELNTPFNSGYKKGITLFWQWTYENNEEALEPLFQSGQVTREFLQAAPENPEHPEYGRTAIFNLILNESKHIPYLFTKEGLLTKEMLASTCNNPRSFYYGISPVWLLAYQQAPWINYLHKKKWLTPEMLTACPLYPFHVWANVNVFFLFIERYPSIIADFLASKAITADMLRARATFVGSLRQGMNGLYLSAKNQPNLVDEFFKHPSLITADMLSLHTPLRFNILNLFISQQRYDLIDKCFEKGFISTELLLIPENRLGFLRDPDYKTEVRHNQCAFMLLLEDDGLLKLNSRSIERLAAEMNAELLLMALHYFKDKSFNTAYQKIIPFFIAATKNEKKRATIALELYCRAKNG